jgi:hypothetical protein
MIGSEQVVSADQPGRAVRSQRGAKYRTLHEHALNLTGLWCRCRKACGVDCIDKRVVGEYSIGRQKKSKGQKERFYE